MPQHRIQVLANLVNLMHAAEKSYHQDCSHTTAIVSNSIPTTGYCLCLDIALYSLFFCVACTLNVTLLGSVGENLAVNLWNVSKHINELV